MTAFPFLKLPAELRVRIYRYLLHAHREICIGDVIPGSFWPSRGSYWRHFLNEGGAPSAKTLRPKTIKYSVIAIGVHSAILSANQQTYLEASRVLYSENRFRLGVFLHETSCDVREAMMPFLEDLTRNSRRLIKQLEITFFIAPCLHYMSMWSHTVSLFEDACIFLCQFLDLDHLTLGFQCLVMDCADTAAPHEDCPFTMKRQWLQQLVPLIRNLKTFEIVERHPLYADWARAAQPTFLASKIHGANQMNDTWRKPDQRLHWGQEGGAGNRCSRFGGTALPRALERQTKGPQNEAKPRLSRMEGRIGAPGPASHSSREGSVLPGLGDGG